MISNPIILFITFSWLDAIDILLVAVLLFQLYRLVKGTVAINIVLGIISIFLVWKIVLALKMELLSEILGKFIGVGVIAIIIVFQQELRRFLLFVGTSGFFDRKSFNKKLFSWKMNKTTGVDLVSIVKACKNMSESRTGAILVITTKSDLNFYANTGEAVDAKVSARMIESIFYKNSPLHDGAVIITDNKIKAARCVLPVTEDPDFPGHLGMRHRAAAGITENSDAIAIAVSEQTGEISLAKDGKLFNSLTTEKLRELLEKELN
jgi:diadenylate cyclase